MRPPRPPYALDTPVFAFASLANFAARAPLGGVREIAIAAYVTARMAEDVGDGSLLADARCARAAGARKWLSTLAISEPIRRIFIELIAATETDAKGTAAAVRRVIEITGAMLDAPSRADLDRLAEGLEGQSDGIT